MENAAFKSQVASLLSEVKILAEEKTAFESQVASLHSEVNNLTKEKSTFISEVKKAGQSINVMMTALRIQKDDVVEIIKSEKIATEVQQHASTILSPTTLPLQLSPTDLQTPA